LKKILFKFNFQFLACRIAQILHYICSIIALLSCLLISLLLTSRDLHIWNTTKTELPSHIFLIDILCLIWAIGETILRTLSTPSLYNYFTKLGLFDITGVVFHFIYIYMIGTGTKPRFGNKAKIFYFVL
jgi:hypothetical protein